MTTDSRNRAASESPAHPGGRLRDAELSVGASQGAGGGAASEKLAPPPLPLIEASPIPGAVAGLENPLPRQAEELRGSVPPGDSQPGGRCPHASISGSVAHEMPRPEAPGSTSCEASSPETAGEPGMPGGAAPSGPAASHVPSSGVATFVPVAGAPATGPTGHGGAHCDRCGRPCAGTMCEPCLRYELVRPGRLLAYTSSEVDELAEAADAAASYWTGIAAWLRTEAARRAE